MISAPGLLLGIVIDIGLGRALGVADQQAAIRRANRRRGPRPRRTGARRPRRNWRRSPAPSRARAAARGRQRSKLSASASAGSEMRAGAGRARAAAPRAPGDGRGRPAAARVRSSRRYACSRSPQLATGRAARLAPPAARQPPMAAGGGPAFAPIVPPQPSTGVSAMRLLAPALAARARLAARRRHPALCRPARAAPDFTTSGALAGRPFRLNLRARAAQRAGRPLFLSALLHRGCTLEAHAFSEAARRFPPRRRAGDRHVGRRLRHAAPLLGRGLPQRLPGRDRDAGDDPRL